MLTQIITDEHVLGVLGVCVCVCVCVCGNSPRCVKVATGKKTKAEVVFTFSSSRR